MYVLNAVFAHKVIWTKANIKEVIRKRKCTYYTVL